MMYTMPDLSQIRCRDLAMTCLSERHIATTERIDVLAELIKVTIEDYINDEGAPTCE